MSVTRESMIKTKNLLILIMMLTPILTYAQVDFAKGVTVNEDNLSQLTESSLPYAASFCGWDIPCLENESYPLAFVETDVESFYYSLKSKAQIVSFNIDTQEFFSGWIISHWSYQTYSSNIQATYDIFGEAYPFPYVYFPGLSLGCLGDELLRYGDLESDGINELIIFNGMLTVFSPQYQRTVFAAFLSESDWVLPVDAARKFDEGIPGDYQYVSKFLTDNNGLGAAIRSYSKLYIGNYDGDDDSDILIWRKDYRSNLKTNPTVGFAKIADEVFHYELDLVSQEASSQGITGEYLPQDTTAKEIRTWLSENNLTWQSGYPSQSECEGQEGQLIPELHDPLLNDPDVLQ